MSPVTADHTPERLSAEEREAIWRDNARADCRKTYPTKGRVQQSLREVLHERDALAAHLADVEARLAAVEALMNEPGVRHLQPPNWRDRVLAALYPDPTEGEA